MALETLLTLAVLTITHTNPTLHRDVLRWQLHRQEIRHDIRDLQQRINRLDRLVDEQLNRRTYSSAIRNIK